MKEDLKNILLLMGGIIHISKSENISKEWTEELKQHKSELNIIYNGMPND